MRAVALVLAAFGLAACEPIESPQIGGEVEIELPSVAAEAPDADAGSAVSVVTGAASANVEVK